MDALDQFKGIEDLYNNSCDYWNQERFFIWRDKPDLSIGIVCLAPAWYEKNKRWYLVTHKHDPIVEENSTFYAREYPLKPGSNPPTNGTVLSYFDLAKDENLVATHGKKRPVILLRYHESTWFNKFYPKRGWLCLPVFSYHARHDQQFVLNDQRFKTPDRVYMPRFYDVNPGMLNESALHLGSMQLIEDKYLHPIPLEIDETLGKMYFGVSEFALKLITMHMMNNIGILDAFIGRESREDKDAYDCFVLYVNELMDATIKDSNQRT